MHNGQLQETKVLLGEVANRGKAVHAGHKSCLVDFLRQSPLSGASLVIERDRSLVRHVAGFALDAIDPQHAS